MKICSSAGRTVIQSVLAQQVLLIVVGIVVTVSDVAFYWLFHGARVTIFLFLVTQGWFYLVPMHDI
jgi:hypothetical protein